MPIGFVVVLGAATIPQVSAAPTARTAWTAQSVNLLSDDQAGFEASPVNWGSVQATLATVTAPTHSGTGALAVTAQYDASSLRALSRSDATSAIAVTPGARYAARLWASADTTPRDVSAGVFFLDSSGRVIASAVGQPIADQLGSWQQTPVAVGVVPPSASYVVAGVVINNMIAGETHVIDDASLTMASGGSADVAGPLATSGNRVLDVNGKPVVLRGFTRVGMEGSGDAPAAEELGYAKRWGANIIRLPVSDAFWLSTSCNYDSSYADEVDSAVNAVTALGMVALVDLHTNATTPCGDVHQQPMAEYPDAVTFWQQVANRYRSNPLVAFDLYNEPHDISDDVWRNGGIVTWRGTTFEAAGMQQMYDAIRAAGADNLIVVSGTGWANNWPSTAPLAGTNVVYSAHAYTCPVVAPPNCASSAPYEAPSFLDQWIAPGNSYPVIIGEFGFPDANDGRYNASVIATAESHGWGWSQFTWGDATWGSFDLLATAGHGATYEPKPAGMPALAAFPGPDPDPDPGPASGAWLVPGLSASAIGHTGDVPVPGDYNGDGITDPGVWRPSDGDWDVKGTRIAHLGAAGDVRVPGDYNHDGKTDIAVWRPSSGNWYVAGRSAMHFGTLGDIPVLADYNGDGVPDLAVFRPANGDWYIDGRRAVHFGMRGDVPTPADRNGDGRAEIGVWRPGNGDWYVPWEHPVHFGTAGDIPVLGDYTGDHRSDRAVWRPTTGGWYVEGLPTWKVGKRGDVPVPGQYDGSAGIDRAVWQPPQ
ncbi:MAG: cellulase family glycosylhydrolase [Actinomycetes bacterium]